MNHHTTGYRIDMAKSCVSRSRTDVVTNGERLLFANDEVPSTFVSHYEAFLGQAGSTYGFNTANLFKTCLDEQVALNMVRTVSNQEVKDAIFSMGDVKSPGPDGYRASFFKEAWDIVGNDVTNAIREFFTNGNLLKELNHTIIALIPKVKFPSRVNDYRPISCCNVLFKCISKIIANRIKQSLKVLISPNQSAFIPGRSISDNILLTHELMHNYHLDRGTPRWFRGLWSVSRRHLILFALTALFMDIFKSGEFTYHRYCSKLELINLCFADDLFLFAYGDVHSASIIKEALDEFKDASRLTPSLPKSTAYFDSWCEISVLGSMHIYWASVFIIPSRVLLDIDQIIRGFLWCHGPLKRGKAKVAWEVVCLPKDEGGLGILRLEYFNSALMVSHIWKLLSFKESLWVKWIHEYKLNERSFWDVPLRGNMSWGSRKMLQLRPIIHDFIWCKLDDGARTSLWFDRWCDVGPIAKYVSTRDMFRSGLSLTSKG
ncbi:hypothetical protein Tco_1455303 [Tanacetum coccineum]